MVERPVTVLGSRLPEPYFSWVIKARQSWRRLRRCGTCGNVHTTVEVPIAIQKWPQESSAECCPKHTKTKGTIVLGGISPTEAVRTNRIGQGVLLAISMGGVYRRRACTLNYVGDKRERKLNPQGLPCKDEKGKPTRWSTVELDSSGVVQKDVSLCSRCGGRTRVFGYSEERLVEWAASNKTSTSEQP